MSIGVEEPKTTNTSDPELLFEEARELQRRRQKRRTTVLVAAGILVVLGLSAYRNASRNTTASAQSPSPVAAVVRHPVVVYEKVETVVRTPHLPTLRRTGEVWFSTAAPWTYREVLTIGGGPTVEVGAAPGHDPKLGNEILVYLYDAKANTVYETGAYFEPSGRLRLRSAFRRFLAEPGVRLEGTRLFEGHKVYAAGAHGRSSFPGGRESVTMYVDTATYQPLLSAVAGPGMSTTVRVLVYKTLPATPTNLRLTNLARSHPGARVVHTWPPPAGIHELYGEANQIGSIGGSDLGPFGG
jgi:hypothetical protein